MLDAEINCLKTMLIVDVKISLINFPYALMYLIDLCYLSYVYSCVNNI